MRQCCRFARGGAVAVVGVACSAVLVSIAGAVGPAAETGTPDLVPRDWALQAWTLITFFVVLGILSRFAYRPLREMLDRRDAALRDSLARADQARAESERLAAEQADTYRKAKDEARAMMEESRTVSQRIRKEAESEARRHATEIADDARQQIEEEVRAKVDELRETVATLSIRIARQVVKEGIDEKRHNELVDQFMDRVRKSHEGGPQHG